MRSHTETLLLDEIQHRLRAAIPKAVPIVGGDDIEELAQDGVVIAIQLHRRARKAGKKVMAGNLAHYALLHLRAGRRSTGYRKNDVLHPAAQLNGNARVHSLDAPISDDEDADEALTLHDCLAAHVDDPATIAARRLDWEAVLDSLDRILKANGTELVCNFRGLKLLAFPNSGHFVENSLDGHSLQFG